MNAMNDIDRVLDAWFRADAPVSAPSDLLDAISAATSTTRRRSRWLAPEQWLPWPSRSVRVLRYAALAVLALLVAATAIIAIASRPRVPPPFGPARPGVFALSIDGHIVTMTPDGSGQQRVSSGDAWDSNPTFSRDGTKLAFWSRPTGSSASDLVVMGVDGSGRHVVAREDHGGSCVREASALAFPDCLGPGDGTDIAWSPDGASLAYSNTGGNRAQIFVARADSFGSIPVGDPSLKGRNPSWSPDGSTIAFDGGAYDDEHGVYLMRADGTESRRISALPGSAGAFAASWSPNGQRLAYAGGDGATTMFVINRDGTDEHLVDTGAFVGGASWSPNGERLAWLHADVNMDEPAQIDVADADGRTIMATYPHEGIPHRPLMFEPWPLSIGWSVDGREVLSVLTSDGNLADRLLRIDTDTGETVILDTPGMRAWNQQRLAP